MKKSVLPTISVVMATYNSGRTLERVLASIRSQSYPERNIEIILADGGSTDNTKAISKRYGVRFVSVDPSIQNAERNKSIGLLHAKHELVAFIDHDNVLPHKHWMKAMVLPFLEHSGVVGCETLRYEYSPQASLIDRYFALFGAGDPLVWYLGKADRLSYLYESYNLAGSAVDHGSYYVVTFSQENVPTIGANGFFVRRKVLLANAQTEPGQYFDMDVNVDLIRKGFNTYAFIKDSILHLTGYGNIWNYLKRRYLFMTKYRFSSSTESDRKNRRYGKLTAFDQVRLVAVICICLTWIIPIYHSVIGYRKIKDMAWFLHPLLCFGFVLIYSWAIIYSQLKRYAD